MKGEKKVRHTL